MISIIIPVYNEEKTILKVLKSTMEAFQDIAHEILIINDGSRDATETICQNICNTQKNIKFIQLNRNYGKGYALRTGFKEMKGEFMAIQDADLEYDPRNLRKLCHQLEEDKVIYGQRDGKTGYLTNRIGNATLSFLCNILYNSNLCDIYTCYKIIPRKILESLDLSATGFEIEAEITAKLLLKKIPIIEIPISYSPRSRKDGKHIRTRDGLIGIWTLIKNRF